MAAYGIFKEPKNILELFTFDLTTFFYEEDYEEISSIEQGGVFMIEYKKVLPLIELNLFNSLIFRVFNDKNNIIGSNHINVRLETELNDSNRKYLVKLVHKLYQIYGTDDDNKADWGMEENQMVHKCRVIRQWTLGEGKNIYTLRLSENNTELMLEILFFNHLLKLIK